MNSTDNNLYLDDLNSHHILFADFPDVVSVSQVMDMLHIGKSSAYALLQSNQIKHVRIGRKYIIPKKEVIAFLNNFCYNDEQIIGDGLLTEKGVTK